MPAGIRSFASCAAKLEEILLAGARLVSFRLVKCFVESFLVSVSYTVAIVDVSVAMLAAILDAGLGLEAYFAELHRDDVAFENPVRCHAPATDCN